jgi:hypothetical protein
VPLGRRGGPFGERVGSESLVLRGGQSGAPGQGQQGRTVEGHVNTQAGVEFFAPASEQRRGCLRDWKGSSLSSRAGWTMAPGLFVRFRFLHIVERV